MWSGSWSPLQLWRNTCSCLQSTLKRAGCTKKKPFGSGRRSPAGVLGGASLDLLPSLQWVGRVPSLTPTEPPSHLTVAMHSCPRGFATAGAGAGWNRPLCLMPPPTIPPGVLGGSQTRPVKWGGSIPHPPASPSSSCSKAELANAS